MRDESLTPRKQTYGGPEQTAQTRAEAIRNVVSVTADLLRKAPVRVDLNDTQAVRAVADGLIRRCGDAGILPSFELLAAALGHHRRGVYKWAERHEDSETSQFFDTFRTACTAARFAAADAKAADPTVAIFLALNSREGFTNEHRVQIEAHPTGYELTENAIADVDQVVMALPDPEELE